MNDNTISGLRVSITDAHRNLAIRESKQESTADELERIEVQCKELGIAPLELTKEAERIRKDVEEAVNGVFAVLETVRE